MDLSAFTGLNSTAANAIAEARGQLGQAGRIESQKILKQLIQTPFAIDPTFTPTGTPGARNVLQALQGRPDPVFTFNWYCDLPWINLGDGSTFTLGWEYIEEGSLPSIDHESLTNYRAGKNYNFAGHYSLPNVTIKVAEDVAGTAMKYFYVWRSLIFDSATGSFKLPGGSNGYKQTMMFTILDATQRSVMFIKYFGVWPLRVDPISLVSGSSEHLALNVELSVDDVEYQFSSYSNVDDEVAASAMQKDDPQLLKSLTSLGQKYAQAVAGRTISGTVAAVNNGINSILR